MTAADDFNHNGSAANSAIDDAADKDESLPELRYDLSSYGVDFDVEGLVQRLNKGEIIVPEWQRSYVWTHRQASSFIESLLVGLPVPGVFLGLDSESYDLIVIDGQQRLKTLQCFYQGQRPDLNPGRPLAFTLRDVHKRFSGLTYQQLTANDRRYLDTSIIHATVIKQDAPPGSDTSMYHLFQRLNNGGRSLNSQEIRCAIYRGRLIDSIRRLNQYPDWRSIIGAPHIRMKDQELILRFMAMWHSGERYTESMTEFLNAFTQINRNPDESWLDTTADLFKEVISTFHQATDKRTFRLDQAQPVNAAVFDSMSIGLATRLKDHEIRHDTVRDIHDSLVHNEEYLGSVTQATSNRESVRIRMKLAVSAFADA